MTTVATMTTKPARAEPMMRGSWSCTERSGSSGSNEEAGDKFQMRAALPKTQKEMPKDLQVVCEMLRGTNKGVVTTDPSTDARRED